jgi:hypothetical protein
MRTAIFISSIFITVAINEHILDNAHTSIILMFALFFSMDMIEYISKLLKNK